MSETPTVDKSDPKRYGTNGTLLRKHVLGDATSGQAMAEIKSLSPEDKQDLGDAIRDEIDRGVIVL